jgi:hypothetical protein
MENCQATFLILVVPPDGKPYQKTISSDIKSMEKVLESGKANFDYYKKVIIATNRENNGYIENHHVKGIKCYGTCYFIGNLRDDDFRSLYPKEIKNLLTESLIM